MEKYNERELIREAEKRGYRTGTIIDYDLMLKGTDTLGCGEFKLIDDYRGTKLIKYETKDNGKSLDRRFDTIWDKNRGWTKIVNRRSGLYF